MEHTCGGYGDQVINLGKNEGLGKKNSDFYQHSMAENRAEGTVLVLVHQ